MDPVTATPPPEFVQWLATLGVGGVLAGLMFYFYRKDMKFYTDSWKSEAEGWKTIVSDNTKAMSQCTKMTELVFNYLINKPANSHNGSDNGQ